MSQADAIFIAALDGVVFYLLCFQILVDQGTRYYSLSNLPHSSVIVVNATSTLIAWFSCCLLDALAVAPCLVSWLIASQMEQISPLVRNFEFAYATAAGINLLYHFAFEQSALRGTPGKLLCGLEVQKLAGKPSAQNLLVRHFAKIIALPAIVGAFLAYVFLKAVSIIKLKAPQSILSTLQSIAFGDDGVWPHDFLSGTRICATASAVAGESRPQ
ncbi:hypothetical protein BH11CYA1_BH11CYA1_34990 [soil metagenome]